MNKAPASFDPKKLMAFEERHFQLLPPEQKVALVVPFLEKARLVASPPTRRPATNRSRKVVAAAGDRIKVAGDILAFAYFFQSDDQLAYDEQAVEKHLRKDGVAGVAGEVPRSAGDGRAVRRQDARASMHDFMAAEGIKIGQIIHAVRVAVTGQSIGLGLFDTLAILGREHCLRRIDRVLTRVRFSFESRRG